MFPKKILKKIPIIRRVYPSLVKKLFKLISKSEIKFNFFGINLIGDINEPMDKEIYLFNQYENKQIIFLIENIKKSNFEYFIDVGANSGVYSLIVNKEFKYIKIKSYEPIKKSIEKFIINKKMNQKLKNIRIYKYGLSDRNMHLLMKSQIRDKYVQTGGFGVVTKKDRINDFHTEKAVFKKGDDILKIKNKKVVLKIDTEGHEEFVLKGFKKFLKNNEIFLQIEIYNQHFNKVDKFLKKFKFLKINSFSSDGKIDYYYKNY
tara:strand:- start:1626 stop:2408 length:783 start_codon:yes stop_codon:yes gene_type:complete